MHIHIDIETIPDQRRDARTRAYERVKVPANYKKPEAIAKYREEAALEEHARTSLQGAYGEVYCVCLAVEDGPIQTFSRGDAWTDAATESLVLEEVQQALLTAIGHEKRWCQFVGHNVEFDLRFLFHRMVVRRVHPMVYLPYNDATWKGSYYDTQYAWAGARGNIRLKELSDALGILPGSNDIDGSDVWKHIQAGDGASVEAHCALDVERVREIHKRLTFQD